MSGPKRGSHNSAPSRYGLTFLDHVRELKVRLTWVVAALILGTVAAYPFFTYIAQALVWPLGEHRLYYTTPAGGLGFIIKICMYVGAVVAVPVFVYQTFQFLRPVTGRLLARRLVLYTLASILLALGGIAFAYFISLPAALNFLTGIDMPQVGDLLTLDSYLSFVSSYIIAGALLFQLPLLMLIFNSVTPLPPSRLMGYQRHVIVASFVFGAIVSPTPDVVNQTVLAAPMIVMYQVGIIAVWFAQRRLRRTAAHSGVVKPQPKVAQPLSLRSAGEQGVPLMVISQHQPLKHQQNRLTPAPARGKAAPKLPALGVDGSIITGQKQPKGPSLQALGLAQNSRPPVRRARSVDGFARQARTAES